MTMIVLEETEVATRGRAWLRSLAGQRVTVVGLAKSGIAAARLLREVGAEVTGVDARPVDRLARTPRRSPAPTWWW
jgi:UDP-N-acetylmuramoylalanine-D-glutamate ligase